jgi:hypothetical protein
MKGWAMIRKFLLLFFFIIFGLFLVVINADAGFEHFVRAEGDKLMDGNKEYRFISFNIPNLHMIEDQMPFDKIQA